MSHQDQGREATGRSHADDLQAALRWLLPIGSTRGLGLRPHCTWSGQMLAWGALLWVWSDEKTLIDRFQAARQIIRDLFAEQPEPAESYQAFVKLLRKGTGPLREILEDLFRQRMREVLAPAWRIEQWLVFACDGSRIEVPRTRRNEERYSPQSQLSREAQKRRRQTKRRRTAKRRERETRQRKANVPRIGLTTLWHVGSGLPWAWRTGPSDSSERGRFEAMLSTLPGPALLTADAGFVGYRLWQRILENGRQLLIRVGGKLRSHHPDNALVEIEWSLLGMWAMGLYAQRQLIPQGVRPERIRFAGLLRAFRRPMREYRCVPRRGERLRERLDRALIDDYLRQNKASRDYPRKKQETPAGPPRIRNATHAQIQLAQSLKHQQNKRLTA